MDCFIKKTSSCSSIYYLDHENHFIQEKPKIKYFAKICIYHF